MPRRMTIHMLPPGETWRPLGNFSADSDAQMAELKALLEGRDPFEVMDRVPNQMVWDVLDILRKDGCEARVEFHDDH